MNIVVLAGGTSTERDVSIVSGIGVCKALRTKEHRAILVDVFSGDSNADLTSVETAFPAEYDVEQAAAYIRSFNEAVPQMISSRKGFFGPNVLALCDMADVVFLALHGANGEDGKLQATLELFGIPYTGTGYLSSAIAMDKGMTKQIFRTNEIPTPMGILQRKTEEKKDLAEYGLEYPVIVKPCCGGSSVGVTIANDQEEYAAALAEAFALENEVVVEEFIVGREFSVAVVDGKALPVIEIAPKSGFYDYKNKYQAGSTVETCPADLSKEKTQEMQRLAEKGAETLGITGYCRLDFLMRAANDKLYCLEANTLPGMTPTSLLPQEAAVIGMDYPALCEKLIAISLKQGQN